jgi:uncharacterized protein YfdQ (DUF2303 family)
MDKTPAPVAPDPRAALEVALDAARLANPVITGPDGRTYAALPATHKLTEMADRKQLPVRPAEALTFDNQTCLANYVNRFRDDQSILLADYAALTVTARLDWHPNNAADNFGEASADTHTATLKLQNSEEFARWDKAQGNFMDQADFARFLEENSADIASPDPTIMIELARDFEATAGHVYKSSTRLDNGDRRVVFETDTRAREEMVVPQRFDLLIPVYNGEAPETLTCLFRWRAAGGKVQFAFVWHRLEYQRRARFQQIAFSVADATGVPVFMGRSAA